MQHPTKTQAIKRFLTAMTHLDLAELYHHDMECQVIVARDGGEQVEGEYKGKRWCGYSDGLTTWKSFRIPYSAYSSPNYEDRIIKFDLMEHAEAIGMTGWNWKDQTSEWVAFDFDAITGHSDKHTKKLSLDDLKRVSDVACEIPWVTVRHSTSGKGLHLYVMLPSLPGIETHTQHSALARAILHKMSALAGYDFSSKVDICGGNMWIWHRKMAGTDGLKIIKQGDTLYDLPSNWRDHLTVVSGERKKIKHRLPDEKSIIGIEGKFEQLTGQRNKIKLDEEHLRLIKYLEEKGKFFWWDADHHMLVTHTKHLEDAHESLNLQGIFKTTSGGTNLNEQNCFCFPVRRGGWTVRRYSQGCTEHESWDQDAQGWTRCTLNIIPTLKTSSLAHNGIEDPSGGFTFRSGTDAAEAALVLGADLKIPVGYDSRSTTIKPHKDGKRIVVEFHRESDDNNEKFKGWLQKNGKWIKIFTANLHNPTDIETDDFDDMVRHLVTEAGTDAGWVINSDGVWHDEPLQHVKAGLDSFGLKPYEVKNIIGSSVFKPWKLVNKPFEMEYPGDRQWNRYSPQFRVLPNLSDNLTYPSWLSLLQHIGTSLDLAIKRDDWCITNGITSGADYLKCWIASMLQFPYAPLPYLFIYSDRQNTGKSILHEALNLLFSPGYQRAETALKQSSSHNGELEQAILCVIEEIDLSKNKSAYDFIKDWVTSPTVQIHKKYLTPYMIQNTTHWIQCANSRTYCPIFPGDTRIVVIHVPEPPVKQIAKGVFLQTLEKEASDFLGACLQLEIPPSNDRLNIPVIETDDKLSVIDSQRSALDVFLTEQCEFAHGFVVTLSDFYGAFIESLDPSERFNWNSKQKVSAQMPDCYPKGRLTNTSTMHWGNLRVKTLAPTEYCHGQIISLNGVLVPKHET